MDNYHWLIRDAKQRKVIGPPQKSEFSFRPSGPGDPQLVEALSKAVAAFAKEVAESIAGL